MLPREIFLVISFLVSLLAFFDHVHVQQWKKLSIVAGLTPWIAKETR